MKYIVYIITQTNYYNISFIEKDKLDIIVNAILENQKDFFLDGKRYFLNNLLEIRIFEIESKEKYQEQLKKYGKKVQFDFEYVDGQNKAFIKPNILKNIIKEVSGEILNKKINNKTETKIEPSKEETGVIKDIFISHSSKDKLLVDKFVEKIFNLGLGLNKDDIFCTSTEGYGIKTGEDFRQAIKSNIENSKITILLITPNYKKSEVCLNEMGAAWVLNSKVIPVIIEPIDFKSVGVIVEPLQIARLNDSSFLDEFSQIILETTSKGNLDVVNWNKHKTEFIDIVNNYIQILKTVNDKFPVEYFEQFLAKNIDITQLLQEAHPTKVDCKKLFSEEYAEKAFNNYCEMFSEFEKERISDFNDNFTSYKVSSATIPELIKGNDFFSGGTNELAKNYVFNIDQKIYRVDFLKNEDSESGYSFEIFTFYNNRVVFFPKPYRLGLLV